MMNIVVCIKQVRDTRAPLSVENGSLIQKEPEPVSVVNPKDIAALEEAMSLKQQFGAAVTALTLGDKESEQVLRYCLARGVDRAIHILSGPEDSLDTYSRAAELGRAISGLPHDLVLCGNRSQGEGRGSTVPFLADFLGCPQLTRVVKLEVDPAKRSALVWRQLERGWREEVECGLPAVIGIERTSREAQYVSVFAREAAAEVSLQTLFVEPCQKGEVAGVLSVISLGPPRPRTKKSFVPDANLSPEERFKMLLSGGVKAKKSADTLEGSPGQVAKELVDYLKKEGFLTKEAGGGEGKKP